MYSNIKLAVQDGRVQVSPFFKSRKSVRHGDNLSPTLFNIFINDLPDIFDSNCDPVKMGDMSISSMIYADDLMILSESLSGLQHWINWKYIVWNGHWGLIYLRLNSW